MLTRHFTLMEATALLPLVMESAHRMQAVLQEHNRLRDAMRAHAANPSTPLRPELDTDTDAGRARLSAMYEEVSLEIAQLQALGVQVKGLDPVLVDFPALRDGQTVLLCWRAGETAIGHFHTVQGGFTSRQPIAQALEFGAPVLQ